jgi:hypothetical protein
MAIQATINTSSGLSITDAYCKITEVSITKNSVTFTLQVFADKTKTFVIENVFTAPYDLDGPNPIKQAYEHLKTLPEFEGAEDC